MRNNTIQRIIENEILADEGERFSSPYASIAGGRDNLKTLSSAEIRLGIFTESRTGKDAKA
jgi:hypothetical protein